MTDLAQFRADFALVYRTERAHGHVSEDEAAAMKSDAGAAVQSHMGDPEWMAAAAAHYHDMAEQIRSDRVRSERIAAEVRAERGCIEDVAAQPEGAK